jgi:hypothetical protein
VVTNCRVPVRNKPVQIHLGYLSLRFEGEIPPGQRAKLLRNLRRRWLEFFPADEVDVDWVDAEKKLDRLRTLVRSAERAAYVPPRGEVISTSECQTLARGAPASDRTLRHTRCPDETEL